jgi:CheY-like chemotaxis protein
VNEGTEKVILLVEDNEDDAFFTKQALEKAGVQNPLLIVGDGAQALEYLGGTGKFMERDKFPFPGLVLLDLKLPYYSGLEILAWLREKSLLAKTTVAVLTSSNEPSDLKRAYELGTTTYLVKPPTAQMIYDIVETFKLDWLRCNANPKHE